MGVFDMKPASSGQYWNYSNESKDGYMPSITGTVVEVIRKQGTDYATRQPKTWPDGSPRAVFQLNILGKSGRELGWVFEMFTKDRSTGQRVFTKPAQAIADALDPEGDAMPSLEDLLGREVTISTEPGVYNQTHPRPFKVVINGMGDQSKVRGAKDLLSTTSTQPKKAEPEDDLYDEEIPF